MLNITSNITFLYFSDLTAAKRFVSEVLKLPVAYDPGWACVYRMSEKSFLGLVDARQGSVAGKDHDGVLISFTVEDVEAVHRAMEDFGVDGLSEIKQVKDLALSSFFFTGPEGYRFEVQKFSSGELKEIF
jgi:predicted enzyme related to lactoylglutathione lyase